MADRIRKSHARRSRAAIGVAAEERKQKTKRTGTLAEFFAASPLRGSGLKVARRKDRPRTVVL